MVIYRDRGRILTLLQRQINAQEERHPLKH